MNADSRYPVGRHSERTDDAGRSRLVAAEERGDQADRPLTGRRGLLTALVGSGIGAAAFGMKPAIDELGGGSAARATGPTGSPALAADRTDGVDAAATGANGSLAPGSGAAPDSGGKPRRPAATRPRDGGSFADRDDSYARGVPGQDPDDWLDENAGPAEYATMMQAAERTRVTARTVLDTAPDLHLLRRFTFGPTEQLRQEIRNVGMWVWLNRQLDPASIPDGEAERVWRAFPTAGMSTPQLRATFDGQTNRPLVEYGRATLARQVWSNRQVFEVMVDFWANHLNVPLPTGGNNLYDVGGPYHNTVIRRHALGKFSDMLHASMRHPAMLRYLNNDRSHKNSVNENLGRELLELHTVGIEGGYTERDVRNSAYILTGRTVNRVGEFVYDPNRHYTGEVTVMDFSHANGSADGGLAIGDQYLAYLANHPATARMIARKLCVRFISDNPPDWVVNRVARAYLEAGTATVPTLVTLLSTRAFWASVGQKTRRPLENVVATMRALGVRPGTDVAAGIGNVYGILGELGHRPLAWAPPDGYPDVAAAWTSAGAMLRTWNLHTSMVAGNPATLRYVAPERLHGATVPDTAGGYLSALCRALTHQDFRGPHREALLTFLGSQASSGADAVTMARYLAPLVLDSPYFALR